MPVFFRIVKGDIKFALRNGGQIVNLLMFFVISVTMFSFGVGADPKYMHFVAPGVIWVCALLSSMLSLSGIFEEDYEDGTLVQLFLLGKIPEVIVMAKILSHWIVSLLPLVVISPFLGVMMGLEDRQILMLVYGLALGTPILSMIGGIGAAVTLGIKRGSSLLSLLVLPLYIPVLIFGTGVVLSDDGFFSSSAMILLAILLFILPVCIFASSAAVKVAIEEGS